MDQSPQTIFLKYRKHGQVCFRATADSVVTPSVDIVVEPAALKVPEGGSCNLAVKLSGPPEKDIVLSVSCAGDLDIEVLSNQPDILLLGLERGQELDGDGR